MVWHTEWHKGLTMQLACNGARTGKSRLLKPLIAVAVSLALILLTACVPGTVSCYRPDTSQGKVVKG